MPDSVVSSCQIDKHGTSLLLGLKQFLNVLSKQNSLIHGLPSPSEPSLLPREKWVNNRLNSSVYEPLEDLVGDTKQGDRTIAFGFSTGFLGLGIATTSALLQTFGILRWRRQEERKPHNQDFGAAPAWFISSGQIESRPEAFLISGV